ncbi:L-dopachrome tautomerase-related protein [Paraburkholderia caribensis]|uniref:L-dopachrome tautomerase-related protein n=1 Tax=Paraburkholderia caribensis TaxID=75105 RepID=UPI0015921F74|nr:L-dopachrome tautomerase-related protein [Paraburkholderia caribensis]
MNITKCAALSMCAAMVVSLTQGAYGGQEPKKPGKALPAERTIGHIEPVFEFYDAMPTGVTRAPNGRIFVNYPRWGDDVPFTVGEIVGGKVVAYPNAEVNREDAAHPERNLISVQSVVADYRNRLWILDTAAPKFSAPVQGGAKLVAVDLATNRVVKTIIFKPDVLLTTTYVNDVRFDFRVGKEGIAYITDSSANGPGGIIVVDLATGDAWRKLTNHPSAQVDPSFVAVVEGKEMATTGPDGKRAPLHIASDGIALSSDGSTLYYSPLSSRHLYSVPTALLRDRNATESQVGDAVKDLGEKGASDGLEADASGAVYAGDFERNSIRKMRPDGTWETIAHDPRILWPDTMSVGTDGYLYFTANQLHRQALFNDGKDLRQKPYTLFRIKVDAAPVELKP